VPEERGKEDGGGRDGRGGERRCWQEVWCRGVMLVYHMLCPDMWESVRVDKVLRCHGARGFVCITQSGEGRAMSNRG
jgi:hypothetical protein